MKWDPATNTFAKGSGDLTTMKVQFSAQA